MVGELVQGWVLVSGVVTSFAGGPPKVEVSIVDEDGMCDVQVEATGLPAYDPEEHAVLTLERWVPQLTTGNVGTLTLVWRDLDEPEKSRSMELLGEPSGDAPCVQAERETRPLVRRANKRLAKGHWEPMPEVPVEFIKFSDMHIEHEREVRAQALEAGETYQVPDHVQVFSRHGQLIVRIPQVKVLERHPTHIDEEAVGVHRIWGHRASGTVVISEVDCYGEDCTCDPGSSSTVVQWSPETLTTIDRRPCESGEWSYDECELQSGYVADVDPWEL